MTKNDEMAKLLPYQSSVKTRLLIRDEDLQMELTRGFNKGDKKAMELGSEIPYEYFKKKQKETGLQSYDDKLLRKMMKDAAENYQLMMDIHCQLENAYKELKNYHKK